MPELTERAREALEKDEDKPNTPLGLTQWVFEDPSAKPFARLEDEMRRLVPLSGATKETYTAQHGLEANTIDVNYSRGGKPSLSRVKLFYPKYGYGSDGGAKHGMCKAAPIPQNQKCQGCKNKADVTVAECNDMPKYITCFATDLLHATERPVSPDADATERAESSDGRICKLKSINSALVNLYLKPVAGTSLLKRHYDSPHIFARPIYTLRLLEPATLSFATGGMRNVEYLTKDSMVKANGKETGEVRIPMRAYPIYFDIPLPRGCLTEMSGFAANVLQHFVRQTADAVPTASLVLRHIHKSLLDEKWVTSNSVLREGVPAEGTFPTTGNKRSRECSQATDYARRRLTIESPAPCAASTPATPGEDADSSSDEELLRQLY